MQDRISPSGVRDILQRQALFPKKKLGQNFLVDRNILVKIADSCDINDRQCLLEIGPGLGSLTQELARRSRGVLAVELDTRLEPLLRDLARETSNVKLIFSDILKLDIEAEMDKAFPEPPLDTYKVCANIPYNITTPIIFKLLEQCPRMDSATLMMQKEVGKRLTAVPGSKDYGRLTIMAAYHAHVDLIMPVSRSCFYPRPEVDSVVIKLTPRRQPVAQIYSDRVFRDFVNVAFQKRRKTILNITSDFFGINKSNAQANIEEIGLKPTLRPEDLSLMEIIKLVNSFAPDANPQML